MSLGALIGSGSQRVCTWQPHLTEFTIAAAAAGMHGLSGRRTMYTFNVIIFRVKQGEYVYEEPHITGLQSDVEGRRVALCQRCTACPTPTAVLGERELEPGGVGGVRG